MRGKILNYNSDKGFGFILGEDNQKYFFHISSIENPMDIKINYSVDFQNGRNEKGLTANNIIVSTPSFRKDEFLKLGEHRIRASEIKRYRLEDFWDDDGYSNGTHLIIDTFDGEEIKIWFNYGAENALNYLDEKLGG